MDAQNDSKAPAKKTPSKIRELLKQSMDSDENNATPRPDPKSSNISQVFKRNRQLEEEAEVLEALEIDFVYDDTDSHSAELAELYSYTEQDDFILNSEEFDDLFNSLKQSKKWTAATQYTRKLFVLKLLNDIDIADVDYRLKVARALLYLCQGTFCEVSNEKDFFYWTRNNVFLLYQEGAFTALFEILKTSMLKNLKQNSTRKSLSSDSNELRVILNILYTMLEVIRHEGNYDDSPYQELRNAFVEEISQPIIGGELPAGVLFHMVTYFCAGKATHFPIKKILLLLWKVLVLSLGGIENLQQMKNEARVQNNLPPLPEDALLVMRTMKTAAPPVSVAEIIEQHANKSRKAKKIEDDDVFCQNDDRTEDEENGSPTDDDDILLSAQPSNTEPPVAREINSLPWVPKIRRKDIEDFLDHSRTKFVGYKVGADIDTLAGLPKPIHESVQILKQHLYTSLGDIQIAKEDDLLRYPVSQALHEDVPETECEILYRTLYPHLPQCMIALLKILLAAAPTSSHTSNDSVNVLVDLLPYDQPNSILPNMKLGLDMNRHKEIIVKSVSAILILLLKHFKLNHIYQFEFCAQHLVFANCIPLVLKFFNQNINAYIAANNSISALDFPACVIGKKLPLTAETLETDDMISYSWRNVFSCINLLRILNKLVKWKNSRIMMLVVFKSAPILKRALKVRNAMLQLYVLKLLKLQTKFLGRQWRKSNMKTLSAIYQKVRHRIQDDWAFGNEMDSRPWDFQVEESSLRNKVEKFNGRRYDPHYVVDAAFSKVDNNIQSVLGQHVQLTQDFCNGYQRWLDREVFLCQIKWEELLKKID